MGLSFHRLSKVKTCQTNVYNVARIHICVKKCVKKKKKRLFRLSAKCSSLPEVNLKLVLFLLTLFIVFRTHL